MHTYEALTQKEVSELPIYIDTDTAAKVLGLSRSFLERCRNFHDRNGPPFVVFGRAAIRYHTPTLLEWAQSCTVDYRRKAAKPNEAEGVSQ